MSQLEIHLQQPDGGQVHAGERTERRSGAGMRKEAKASLRSVARCVTYILAQSDKLVPLGRELGSEERLRLASFLIRPGCSASVSSTSHLSALTAGMSIFAPGFAITATASKS